MAYYLDAGHLDPSASSRAVYDLVTGRRDFEAEEASAERLPLRLAVGAENQPSGELVGEDVGGTALRTGRAAAVVRLQPRARPTLEMEPPLGFEPRTYALRKCRSTG